MLRNPGLWAGIPLGFSEHGNHFVISVKEIQEAAGRLKSVLTRTPCPLSIPLSLATGCQIYCKLEYLQRTGSFKERGACNALRLLPASQRSRGVIAASAGNHALGVAYHAG